MRPDDLEVIGTDEDGFGSLRERARTAVSAIQRASDIEPPGLRRASNRRVVRLAVAMIALLVVGVAVALIVGRKDQRSLAVSPPPTTTASRQARAAQLVHDLATRHFKITTAGLEPSLVTNTSADLLNTEWRLWTRAFGAYRAQGTPTEVPCTANWGNCAPGDGGATSQLVTVPVDLARAQIHIQIYFDQHGLIYQYIFLPPDASPEALQGQPMPRSGAQDGGPDAGPAATNARSFVTELVAGQFRDATARFNPVLKPTMTQAQLKREWQAKTNRLGIPGLVGQPFFARNSPVSLGYNIDIPFKKGAHQSDVQVLVLVDDRDRIAGFRVRVFNLASP